MVRLFRLARFPDFRLFAAVGLGLALLAATPAHASMERARAAQARGDLRAAQIEYRNAVRNSPNSAEARAALAQASLDVGDTDTAEKEARAALERGYDRAAGTALLLRAYLGRGRNQDLLRDFPAPDAQTPPAVAAQILAGRANALLSLDRRDEARAAIAEALRLAPNAAEPHLAAARMALVDNNRAAAIAAVDQALAVAPSNIEALLRKGGFQYEAGEFQPAIETFGKVLAQMPGNVIARTRRAEAYFRLNDATAAQADVDAALRTAPGNPTASYLRALLQARAQDWRGADETLQRMGNAVQNFADGFLLQATVKNALGQASQAEDLARRHVARRPEDPRGAKLLASLELAANRPDAAAGTLDRLASRNAADVEALEMLARAHGAAGRPREAAAALERAAAMAPDNVGILARLALARLATNNTEGAAEAARTVMRLDPNQRGMHQILAAAALNRGDLVEATRELEQVPANQRDSELAGIIEATIRLIRIDLAGARTAFETILRNHPNSTRARLGLARVAAMQGNAEEAERLFAEVLEREPGNGEALGRLIAAARSNTPRAAAARAVLERVQAANPGEPSLALAVASVFLSANEPAKAVAILEAEPLRGRRIGTGVQLLLAEAYAQQEKWNEAIAAARTGLAEEPENVFFRQQLATLMLRNRDPRGAEALLRVGLGAQPANQVLQNALVQVIREDRGLDAALEAADRIAREPSTRPASLLLRGDLLMGVTPPRAEEAAQAFAASYAQAPSRELALRQAGAWTAARKPEEAAKVLEAWLAREPNDLGVASTLAQLEISMGRNDAAERRMAQVVAAQPADGISLNNLAWLLQARADAATPDGKAKLAEARLMAERAYYLSPSPETSDTLGWVLARQGETEAALPLLRAAVGAAVARQSGDLGMFYRLAYALRAAGQRAEAIQILEPVLATDAQFADREAAAKMLAELKAGG
jgi:putative PEP-CTERM system TPR-repeat lipoprotein